MFLVHNASFDLIETHLDITGNREAFAEGVANEAVVGKDVAQVGMIFEDDAVRRVSSPPQQAKPEVTGHSEPMHT
ncbi:hypothetical protein A7P99_02745 [Eikenella sp. NML120348]|nr:hypothetical protein A7P99_02745 [Eikenella sp. NML120348]